MIFYGIIRTMNTYKLKVGGKMQKMSRKDFLEVYPHLEEIISKNSIEFLDLQKIYYDFKMYKTTYETQADFIANTLRMHKKIHSVKSRVKNPERLIEKVIRKTEDRRSKYGDSFNFSVCNYKDEINDLIGIRAIHIFKQDWEEIHTFILDTWKVIEITANVREGDDVKRFEELNIEIKSRPSGYRSVHYLIEFYPTNEKVIAEIQVRTIFEEGYGEIDHQLRYSNKEIPEVLASNLLLFNRIVGSADEMASLIDSLNKDLSDMRERFAHEMRKKDCELDKIKRELELNRGGLE